MDFDIEFDDLFDNAVLCEALATVQDETGLGNQDRKKLWTTALPGSEYVNELLDSEHPDRIQQALRTRLNTFSALRDWLLSVIASVIESFDVCHMPRY